MIAAQVTTSTDSSVGGELPAAAPGAPTEATFDLVLALETLGAAPMADLAGQQSFEVGIDGIETDDGIDDDGSDEADSLAFLAGMLGASILNAATPAGSVPAGTANVAEANPLAADGAPADPGGALFTTQDAPGADGAANKSGDLLAAVDALNATAKDSTGGTGDTAPPGPRTAEWLTHGVRHTAPPVEQQGIATSVRDPRWADDFATRISLMVRGGESQASLQLTPLDLGPMDVNVTVRDGQTSIHFGAAHSETRALIEASLPRLREMLAAQGFNLMDASVSQGFARQNRPDVPAVTRTTAEPEIETRTTRAAHLTGLLDLYV